MWNCNKCGNTNDDQYTICPRCGAAKGAGRFGTQQSGVKNAAAYPTAPRQNAQPSGQPAVRPEGVVQPQQLPQAQYVPDFAHVKAGKGFMLLGVLLALLLPLTLIALAALRHGDWAAALNGLILPEKAAEAPAFWIKYPLYILLTLLAALLSSLPGLWTLGLGKALRRLNRMEELL